MSYDTQSLIYMTDTRTLEGITAKNYDYYLIEGNYDEDEMAQRIKEKIENDEFVHEYRVIDTHLSNQQALNWLVNNMGEKSKYELIHQHKEKEKK